MSFRTDGRRGVPPPTAHKFGGSSVRVHQTVGGGGALVVNEAPRTRLAHATPWALSGPSAVQTQFVGGSEIVDAATAKKATLSGFRHDIRRVDSAVVDTLDSDDSKTKGSKGSDRLKKEVSKGDSQIFVADDEDTADDGKHYAIRREVWPAIAEITTIFPGTEGVNEDSVPGALLPAGMTKGIEKALVNILIFRRKFAEDKSLILVVEGMGDRMISFAEKINASDFEHPLAVPLGAEEKDRFVLKSAISRGIKEELNLDLPVSGSDMVLGNIHTEVVNRHSKSFPGMLSRTTTRTTSARIDYDAFPQSMKRDIMVIPESDKVAVWMWMNTDDPVYERFRDAPEQKAADRLWSTKEDILKSVRHEIRTTLEALDLRDQSQTMISQEPRNASFIMDEKILALMEDTDVANLENLMTDQVPILLERARWVISAEKDL
jgi:hypothetical protein